MAPLNQLLMVLMVLAPTLASNSTMPSPVHTNNALKTSDLNPTCKPAKLTATYRNLVISENRYIKRSNPFGEANLIYLNFLKTKYAWTSCIISKYQIYKEQVNAVMIMIQWHFREIPIKLFGILYSGLIWHMFYQLAWASSILRFLYISNHQIYK